MYVYVMYYHALRYPAVHKVVTYECIRMDFNVVAA